MTKIRYVIASLAMAALAACGTIGGTVSGAGQDLTKAGEWIRSR